MRQQHTIGIVVTKVAVPHVANRESSNIKASDNAKVIRSTLQSKPKVGIGTLGDVDNFTARKNHFIAKDIIAAEAVSAR